MFCVYEENVTLTAGNPDGVGFRIDWVPLIFGQEICVEHEASKSTMFFLLRDG